MNLMRSKEGEELQLIINHMGELSATAQRLPGPITSVERIVQCCQKLYILTSSVPGRPGHILAQGILKVGQKRLFIRRDGVHLVEMSPLCVLDFYVHESCQRCISLFRDRVGSLIIRKYLHNCFLNNTIYSAGWGWATFCLSSCWSRSRCDHVSLGTTSSFIAATWNSNICTTC